MIDLDDVADSAKTAIDSLKDHGKQAAKEFELIADLARNADEHNWRNVISQIFDIAYNNY